MADATLLKYLSLTVYWSPPSRHGLQPGEPYDPTCPHRHDRWLAPTAPATRHRLPPRREPRPQSPPRWSPTAAHRHGTPPSCGMRPPTWPQAPARGRRAGHAGHPPTLVVWSKNPKPALYL